jgi:glutathione S-transferase
MSEVERIPLLKAEGVVLNESSAIVEWIDETYSQGLHLLPSSKNERAFARMIMAWIRCDILDLRNERSTATFF